MKLNEFPENLIPSMNSSLPFGYTEDTKKQVQKIITKGIIDQAPNRKLVEGITIDGRESLDLDDGIWAEKRNDGGYTIFISIADPTEFIQPLSPIDLDAMNKGTSIYLGEEKTIYMLPRELACDLVSLNGDTTKLSQTLQIDYDENLEVINTNFYESRFYNKKRFDYEDFKEQYFYEESEFHNQLRLQDEISQKLRIKRINKGILEFDDAERGIGREDKNGKNIASRLIEEFMVAANVETAKFQLKNYPENGVFRNHMVGLKGKNYLPKQLERAYYSNKMEYHFGLKEENYTHFTSPMRRYLDFILHRQLKSFLRGDEFVYNNEDLRKIVNRYLNQQLNRIYFLEKGYHFGEKISRKYKIVKEAEDSEEKIKLLKVDIKNGVEKGLKLPEEIRNDIIETIQKSTKKGEWMWIIGTYLLSDEKEIIEALKERIIRDKKYSNILNSIKETRLIRGEENKIFKITKIEGKIYIKINGKTIVNGAIDSRDAILKLFEYAINKKETI